MKLALSNNMSVVGAFVRVRRFDAVEGRRSRVEGRTSRPGTAARAGNGSQLPPFGIRHSSFRAVAGFTLVEIAICLAVVAFALVAIIGVLPRGLTAQRDNRTETIVNQDAQVWMEALRSSAQGMDQFLDHVEVIHVGGVFYSNGPAGPNTFSSGREIIGLLSNPERSAGVYADVLALSGNAVEKTPVAADVAFRYRMRVAVRDARNVSVTNSPIDLAQLQGSLYEIRLQFDWPLVNGKTGNGHQTYRESVQGALTPDPADNRLNFFKR